MEFDERCGSKGRGAYVHASTSCIARAAQPARWERALKVSPGTLCGPQVSQVFAELMSRVATAAAPEEGNARLASREGVKRRGSGRVRL